jgi:hypothetical protein
MSGSTIRDARWRHRAQAIKSGTSCTGSFVKKGPAVCQRDRDGLPRGWIKRMKRTIRTLGWRFNANRLVMDYTLKCDVPAAGGTSSDMSQTI